MPVTLESLGLDRLPIEDRIALASDLWESIETEAESLRYDPRAALSELQRRIADDDANPDDTIPWEQVAAEATARWSK